MSTDPPRDPGDGPVPYSLTKVGRYDDLDEETYHRHLDAWNNTRLKTMETSPAHCLYQMQHPEGKKQTDPMKLGTAMHCALLEPDRFEETYQLEPQQPDGDGGTAQGWRNRKDYKAPVAALAARGIKVLTRLAWDNCRRLRDRLLDASGDVRDMLLATTATEVTFVEDDPETGLRCKIRTDALAPGICWDLKKCESIWRFEKHMYELRYFMAAAFYVDVLGWHADRTGAERVNNFLFLVVEDSEPFEFQLLQLDPEGMELGRAKYRGLLNQAAKCVESGKWPGYARGLQTISLPAWAYTQEEWNQ